MQTEWVVLYWLCYSAILAAVFGMMTALKMIALKLREGMGDVLMMVVAIAAFSYIILKIIPGVELEVKMPETVLVVRVVTWDPGCKEDTTFRSHIKTPYH
jgi:hypothetical protein